jgi:2-oxoglutarate ferredoxin oxidoreductase subunit delta
MEKVATKRGVRLHKINAEWCKGCGICVAFCPKGVLEMDQADKAMAARIADCVGCGMCELRCPDLAIVIETDEVAAT